MQVNRAHGGDGRYIQHDQKIHRSVLKRLLFDQAVMQTGVARRSKTYRTYDAISAHIPPAVGARRVNYFAFARQHDGNVAQPWDALMLKENRDLELWEGSSTQVVVDSDAEFRPDWTRSTIPYTD